MKPALLLLALISVACAPQAFRPDTPNPLDFPGDSESTVEQLHRENIRNITQNPGYELWNELHE